MNTGVYAFHCLKNNRYYVGSAQNIAGRLTTHISALIGNRHGNYLLQNDFNEYGESQFEILILVSNLPNNDEILVKEENYWINHFNSKNNGYNSVSAARTHRPNQETRKKHSESMKGKNSNINMDILLKIKDEILRLDRQTIQREIERLVAQKFNVSTRTIGRIIRGEYRLSPEIGGSLKDWKGGVNNSGTP